MIIKILGGGCSKCKKLEHNVIKAADDEGIDYTIEKVTNMNDIMRYGVPLTPALIIDEDVISVGKVLTSEKIKEYLKK